MDETRTEAYIKGKSKLILHAILNTLAAMINKFPQLVPEHDTLLMHVSGDPRSIIQYMEGCDDVLQRSTEIINFMRASYPVDRYITGASSRLQEISQSDIEAYGRRHNIQDLNTRQDLARFKKNRNAEMTYKNSIRSYQQTGIVKHLQRVSVSYLKKFLKKQEVEQRDVLLELMKEYRQKRLSQKKRQIQSRTPRKRTFRQNQQQQKSPANKRTRLSVLDFYVPDIFTGEDRLLRDIIADADEDYKKLNVLVIHEKGKLKPVLYRRSPLDIVYECVRGRAWEDYHKEENYFFYIKGGDGNYLIPCMENIPRVLVVQPSSDMKDLVSKDALTTDEDGFMDFMSALHCNGNLVRLYTPDMTRTRSIQAQMLRQRQQQQQQQESKE
jgi:hypothetical protein